MNLDKKIYSLMEEQKSNGEIGLMIPSLKINKIREIRKQFNEDHNIVKKKDVLLPMFHSSLINELDLLSADYIRCGYWIYHNYNEEFSYDLSNKNPDIIKNNYDRWIDECIKKSFNIGPILNVVIKNISATDTDNFFSYRHGTAKRNTINGLKLYTNLFNINKPIKKIKLDHINDI